MLKRMSGANLSLVEDADRRWSMIEFRLVWNYRGRLLTFYLNRNEILLSPRKQGVATMTHRSTGLIIATALWPFLRRNS